MEGRRLAARTRHLSAEAARWVDRQLAGRVSSLGPAALDRLIAEAAARCHPEAQSDRESRARDTWDVTLTHPDPAHYAGTSHLHATGDTLDLTRFHDLVCAEAQTLAALGDTDTLGIRKAKALAVIADTQAHLDLTTLLHSHADEAEVAAVRRAAHARHHAKIKLYLHASLTDLDAGETPEVGTVESLGPLTLDQIKHWVAHSRLTIQPVLHVATDDTWSVDRHDPPPRMADQVRLRDQTCVFPWCNRPARQCDLDHIDSYTDPDHGGPPGQTTPTNLAAPCRRHHRAKTAGTWTYQRLDTGTYLWTGPGGLTALVTPQGTLHLPMN